MATLEPETPAAAELREIFTSELATIRELVAESLTLKQLLPTLDALAESRGIDCRVA